ncbi:MAG: hypothetical protein ABEH78_02075 [Haloferacaceae archaeon]
MPNTTNRVSSRVRDVPVDVARGLRTALRRSVLAPLRFLAFWASILLPLAYLPLVHGGLTGSEPTVLGALLVANLGALLVGHGYRNDAR